MNRKEHHKKLNELLRRFKATCHDKLDQAIESGALTPEMQDSDNYLLTKAIVSIVGESGLYRIGKGSERDKEIDNLEKFI